MQVKMLSEAMQSDDAQVLMSVIQVSRLYVKHNDLLCQSFKASAFVTLHDL